MNHAHKSWEPPMLLLFFLFGLGVWNRAGVCFLLLVAASFVLWKVRFSPSEVLLLAFSLSYFVADMCDCGLSLRSCMLYLIGPWAAYRLGRCYALEAGSPRSFEALLAAPSLGMALHGLLNWLACLLWLRHSGKPVSRMMPCAHRKSATIGARADGSSSSPSGLTSR